MATLLEDFDFDWANSSGGGTKLNATNLNSMTQKIGEYVDLDGLQNVKRYGAVGDGATDDTAAIEDAVAAISVAGGGTLYFPPGEYIVEPGTGSDAPIHPDVPIQILGCGPEVSVIKTKDGIVTDDGVDWRMTRLSGGAITIRDIGWVGPDTMEHDGDLTCLLVDDAPNTRVRLFNVWTKRFNYHLRNTSGYTNTPSISAFGCRFDGDLIGLASGENVIRSFGLNAPDATQLQVVGCVFTGLGSNEAVDGANHHHCIYMSNSTPCLIEGNRFLNHIDGRHIQFNGAMTVPSDHFCIIRGNYFGRYNVSGNNCVQTPIGAPCIIEGNVFNTGVTGAAPTSDCVIEGDCKIVNNVFKGDGPALGGYHISTVSDADNAIIEILGNKFTGDRAQAIRISTAGNVLSVLNNYFASDYLAHVRLEGTTTDAVFGGNRFRMTTGDDGIRVANSISRLRAYDNEFNGGSDGIQIDATFTVGKLYLRDNDFSGQSANAVLKSGTVTSESSKDNVGYADV